MTETSLADTFVQNGDVAIATRDYGGQGSPILLIPGAGRTLLDFAVLAPLLTPSHRVVAMDVRSHGRSGSGPWTWEDVLADAVAVIEDYEMDQPAVVGHSLGGMFAAKLAGRPGLLSAAVNMDGHGSGKPEQYDGLTPEEAVEAQARMASMQGPEPAPMTLEQVAAMTELLVVRAAGLGVGEESARAVAARTFVEQPDGTFLARPYYADGQQMRGALDELDLFSDYRATTVPLLVYNCTSSAGLEGMPDWIPDLLARYRRGLARDLAALAAENPLVSVETLDSTHDLHLSHAPVVAQQVLRFLSDVSAR